jgi:LytS/YehU family sensor histidine kinase
MAEAAKQFFVGFIHPRTWLAIIIALVIAAIVGLALSDTLASSLSGLSLTPQAISQLKGIAIGLFEVILFPVSALEAGEVVPIVLVIVTGVIAGLIFGLTSKKERVPAKSIIGGLNMAVIYIVLTLVVLVIWAVGITSGVVWATVESFIKAAPIDILATFLIVWWVSAIVAMIVLSAKHE